MNLFKSRVKTQRKTLRLSYECDLLIIRLDSRLLICQKGSQTQQTQALPQIQRQN